MRDVFDDARGCVFGRVRANGEFTTVAARRRPPLAKGARAEVVGLSRLASLPQLGQWFRVGRKQQKPGPVFAGVTVLFGGRVAVVGAGRDHAGSKAGMRPAMATESGWIDRGVCGL